MPRRVWRRDGEMIVEEIVWYRDEWCQRVPRRWLDWCGCRRCCDNIPGDIKSVVDRDGLAMIDYVHGVPFFIVKRGGKYCLSPWPRKLYGWVLGGGAAP